MASQIEVKAVNKVFKTPGDDVIALRDINLNIESGEFVCLLGPSGCGKSTLLNAVAGFSLPSSGAITVDGKTITEPGPDRGMVFQEYALFPWMTVAQNIAFGLKVKTVSAEQIEQKVAMALNVNIQSSVLSSAEIEQKVAMLLETLKLKEFRDRFPKDLSGGMRQRVAIARVLALDSPIMLMDEPFGALDALTRRSLQDELLRIWEQYRKTILFVTHSIEESIYLADRIIVLTYRPGTVKRDVRVTMPRRRDASSAEFNALKRELSLLVMEEQQRHEAVEMQGLTTD